MSEAREKARALLAAAGDEWDDNGVAGTPSSFWAVANAREDYETAHADADLIAAAPGLLAALCDENDALRVDLAKVTAAHAFQSSEVNGLTAEVDCMEHEDSQIRAEVERLRTELAQEAALRAELTAEVKRLKDVGADLLAVAQGCTDYGGGHRDACYDAFQDGIWTVVNVLKKRLAGDDDYQMRVLKAVGSGAAIAEGGE